MPTANNSEIEASHQQSNLPIETAQEQHSYISKGLDNPIQKKYIFCQKHCMALWPFQMSWKKCVFSTCPMSQLQQANTCRWYVNCRGIAAAPWPSLSCTQPMTNRTLQWNEAPSSVLYCKGRRGFKWLCRLLLLYPIKCRKKTAFHCPLPHLDIKGKN